MIHETFTIDVLPFSLTLPGDVSTPLPRLLISIGGAKLHQGVDYTFSGRTFLIPEDLLAPAQFTVVESPNGTRTTFTTTRHFSPLLVVVSLNGVVQSQDPLVPGGADITILGTNSIRFDLMVPEPGDSIRLNGLIPKNFSIGDQGEIREAGA